MTARQLLSHQGGVRHYRADEQPITRRFTSLAEGLALFRDDPLVHEPGTKVLYSTYGYTLLGCAAAGAAGRPFMALLQDAVFAPAGMTATRAGRRPRDSSPTGRRATFGTGRASS